MSSFTTCSGQTAMPIPESGPKISRTLARDDAYNRLRGWIIDGTLKPEEVLHDKHIAALLGVSRTPVREALRRLEDEGLVETALNRWTRVAPLDLNKTAETYAIIEAMEVLALKQAFPRLTGEVLRALDDANHRMRTAAKDREPVAAVVADEMFHEVLISGASNGELLRLLGQLKSRLRRVELAYFDATPRVQASFREHAAIIESSREGSLSRACTALRINWRGSLDRIRASVSTNTTKAKIELNNECKS
jgi:DNA-binding GntR family transcriptional regulator